MEYLLNLEPETIRTLKIIGVKFWNLKRLTQGLADYEDCVLEAEKGSHTQILKKLQHELCDPLEFRSKNLQHARNQFAKFKNILFEQQVRRSCSTLLYVSLFD